MQRINNLNQNLTASGNKNAFAGLTQSPPDGIFGLVTKFKQDTVRIFHKSIIDYFRIPERLMSPLVPTEIIMETQSSSSPLRKPRP